MSRRKGAYCACPGMFLSLNTLCGLWVVLVLLSSVLLPRAKSQQPLTCLACDNIPCVRESPTAQNCIVNESLCSLQNCTGSNEDVCFVTLAESDIFGETLKLISYCSNVNNEDFFAGDCPYNREEQCVLSRRPVGNSIAYGCCCNSANCPGGNLTIPSPPSPPTNPTTTSVTGTTEVEQPSEGEPAMEIIIIIPTVVAVVIFMGVVILAACVCFRKFKFRGSRGGQESGHDREEEFVLDSHSAPLPWTLQRLVGQGRFGKVFCASYHNDLVAVKVYPQSSRDWWKTEYEISSLDSTPHEHIMEYLTDITAEAMDAAGSSPFQFYLVTKFYPLGSLEEFLQGHVTNWDQACCMILSVAAGLRHLHANFYTDSNEIKIEKCPVAHRDLKSSNVLVRSEDGDCVVADLGLALQLKPIDDPREIANCGQVGTPRYMSPEALEARINLYDSQSFKQIDIYALGLVMWEVMSRCCVLTEEDISPYHPPYWDLVPRATNELMKEAVCVQECRPSIPAIWTDHMPLSQYSDMIKECLDRDPEARPTAGNIVYRMTTLQNSSLEDLRHEIIGTPVPDNQPTVTAALTPLNRSRSYISTINPVLIQENSQSSPPPCYSPTNPMSVPFLGRMRPGQNRNSMPHIIQTEVASEANSYRPSRSLRSSVTTPPVHSEVDESVSMSMNSQLPQPLPSSAFQARNFVFGRRDDPFPDEMSTDSGSSSMACGSHGNEGTGSLELGNCVPNSDSGIPANSQSDSAT